MTNDQILLNNFISHAKDENLCINYARIIRDGELSASYDRIRKTRLPVWSISKGFTSVGVGIALDEGLLSLDEKVVDIFPEYCPKNPSKYLDKITVKHLLTMSSGVNGMDSFDSETVHPANVDFLQKFMCADFVEPGTRWEYSSLSTYIVGRAIAKRSGIDLVDYLKPRLFDKLGIGNPYWAKCPAGFSYAGFGLQLSIDELSKFSQLLLGYGEYNKNRIVSKEYMLEATSNQMDNSIMLSGDKRAFWGYGYGYQFILNPKEGFRSDGMFGQFAIAIPSKGVSLAMMSLDDNTARIGTLLYEDVINVISSI